MPKRRKGASWKGLSRSTSKKKTHKSVVFWELRKDLVSCVESWYGGWDKDRRCNRCSGPEAMWWTRWGASQSLCQDRRAEGRALCKLPPPLGAAHVQCLLQARLQIQSLPRLQTTLKYQPMAELPEGLAEMWPNPSSGSPSAQLSIPHPLWKLFPRSFPDPFPFWAPSVQSVSREASLTQKPYKTRLRWSDEIQI